MIVQGEAELIKEMEKHYDSEIQTNIELSRKRIKTNQQKLAKNIYVTYFRFHDKNTDGTKSNKWTRGVLFSIKNPFGCHAFTSVSRWNGRANIK